MALRVLAHFVPGDKVHEFLAPETNWLDIRYCAEDDDDTFYRELPDAEVIWHVLRPLSESDLERATKCRLVHKLGAGVNTIAVDAATRLGIAVANMPGANAASVAEGAVLLMLAALRRLPELDRATRAGAGWPSDPLSGETVRDIGSCTVGLVGYGNIAKRVETIVDGDGCRRAAHQHPRRRPPRLADAAGPARRQRHRLAAPAADDCEHSQPAGHAPRWHG